MGNKSKHRLGNRGSSPLVIAVVVSSVLGLSTAALVRWMDLKESRADRQAQAGSALAANRNSVELIAKLFEKNLFVAFHIPGTPKTVPPPPSVPSWEECESKSPPAACAQWTACTKGSPGCVYVSPSTDGAQPPKNQAELEAACEEARAPDPDCKKVCDAPPASCLSTCKGSTPKPSNCTAICDASESKCLSTCENAIPPHPPCQQCSPDPDTKGGCLKVDLTPDFVPPPKLPGPGGANATPAFDKKSIFLTYDSSKLTALPGGAKFTFGYLDKAKLSRKVHNNRRSSDVQKVADQKLSSGAPIGDAACSADPGACLTQETKFDKVVSSVGSTPGSVEISVATTVPGKWPMADTVVVTKARLGVPVIGDAPLPSCTLSAAPTVVYSQLPLAGQMWTTLTLTPKVNPDSPGLVTSTNIAGLEFPSTGGSRVVPYPYGNSSTRYHGTVTGPGGSNGCSVVVASVCIPRAPVCIPDKCWYPVDNFPRCLGWVVCPNGQGCWYRGEHLGCFAADTMLQLASGGQEKASRLKVGDELWNPVKKTSVRIKSLVIGPEALPLVEIGYGDKTMRVTTKHPVVTRKGLKRADQLELDDELQGWDLSFHRITRLSTSAPPATKNSQTVWNYELDTTSTADEDHFLLAEGIVVGDHYLQVKLGQANKASKPSLPGKKPRHAKK